MWCDQFAVDWYNALLTYIHMYSFKLKRFQIINV